MGGGWALAASPVFATGVRIQQPGHNRTTCPRSSKQLVDYITSILYTKLDDHDLKTWAQLLSAQTWRCIPPVITGACRIKSFATPDPPPSPFSPHTQNMNHEVKDKRRKMCYLYCLTMHSTRFMIDCTNKNIKGWVCDVIRWIVIGSSEE